MTPDQKKNNRTNHPRKRPIPVTVIAVLALAEILLRLYWVVRYALEIRIWALGVPLPLWGPDGPTSAGSEFGLAAFRLIWLLVGVAVLIGLLRMQRWSWITLLGWAGVSLTIGILRYFYRSPTSFGGSDYAVMAVDMLLVFVLNQAEVQHLYQIRRTHAEAVR
jgi:hypothetical protein